MDPRFTWRISYSVSRSVSAPLYSAPPLSILAEVLRQLLVLHAARGRGYTLCLSNYLSPLVDQSIADTILHKFTFPDCFLGFSCSLDQDLVMNFTAQFNAMLAKEAGDFQVYLKDINTDCLKNCKTGTICHWFIISYVVKHSLYGFHPLYDYLLLILFKINVLVSEKWFSLMPYWKKLSQKKF